MVPQGWKGRGGVNLLPLLGVHLDPFGANVCVKHLQEGTHTLPWDPLTPYLVPQGFSWWRKPVEADFPGAEGMGIGIQRRTQAAFGGLGDLGQASHRGDTIHQLCRQGSLHQCQSSPSDEKEGSVSLSALPCHAVINTLFMLLTHLMTVLLVQPQEPPCTIHGKILPLRYLYGFSFNISRKRN